MANPATDYIEIIRGDDESIGITITDTDSSSLIKSGNIFFITIKNSFEDADADAVFKNEYTLAQDYTEYSIDLTNTETELALGTYYADIQWKDNDNKIRTIYRGTLEVTYDITRRKTV